MCKDRCNNRQACRNLSACRQAGRCGRPRLASFFPSDGIKPEQTVGMAARGAVPMREPALPSVDTISNSTHERGLDELAWDPELSSARFRARAS
jgi:hypothetical protein